MCLTRCDPQPGDLHHPQSSTVDNRPGPYFPGTASAPSGCGIVGVVQINGAVALVTGASSGIGYASAVRLAAARARVIAHGRAVGPLMELAERIEAVPVIADLSEPDAPAF